MTKKLKVVSQDKPWYEKGLRFKCTECGQCCTGAPGYIWVSKEEIVQIAQFLNLSIEAFSKKYLREVNGRFSLLENVQNFDCVFLKDKKCQIYSVRPTQCRTFPFWAKHLKSEQAWKEAALSCEGIREDSPVVPLSIIEKLRT